MLALHTKNFRFVGDLVRASFDRFFGFLGGLLEDLGFTVGNECVAQVLTVYVLYGQQCVRETLLVGDWLVDRRARQWH